MPVEHDEVIAGFLKYAAVFLLGVIVGMLLGRINLFF